jgi:multidrug efflux pump subunit AcrA (membrane-fusion protein)
MGNLVRADKVWIELTLPHKHLGRVKYKEENQAGAQATFMVNGYHYQGEVISTRVDLTSLTRMAGVIVEVTYKEAYKEVDDVDHQQSPPLLIGTHINANLSAGIVQNSLKIPSKALTANNQVYVIDSENKLQLREAVMQWQLSDHLLIKPSFKAQDRLIVSRISGMAPGSVIKAI